MHRQIKVRGRSVEPLVEEDKWVYGFGVDVVELSDGGEEWWLYTSNGSYKTYFETVGQFTGLYDWNGKEIYDGDIVKLHDPSETKNGYISRVSVSPEFGARVDPHPVHVAIGISTVKRPLYNYCSYGISEELDVMCEIIGNVYEHPHLLKREDGTEIDKN